MSYPREDIRAWKGRDDVGLGVGGNHRNAKLTEDDVRAIKTELARPRGQRRSQAKIAEAYGVGRGTVDHINRGHNWAHVRVEEDS